MTPNCFVPSLATGRGSFIHSTRSVSRRPTACIQRNRIPKMLVVEAKSGEDMDLILDTANGALVVVDYSTSWCGPCKVIAPLFEKMSNKYTDVVFVKVMGDSTAEAGSLMKREGIRAVPAFHFWKNKERVHAFVGAKAEEVEATIQEYAAKTTKST